jgi:hypothetical protein
MPKSAPICQSPRLLITTAAGTGWGNGAGSVSEDSRRAPCLQQAHSYLRNADPVLARLIDDRPAFDLRAWLAQLDLYGALLFQVRAACSPPLSSRQRYHRSPGSGAVEHERRLHASRPDPRCHALVLGLRGLPGPGTQ